MSCLNSKRGAQHGEILLALQFAAVVEAFVESLAEIEEGLFALTGACEGTCEIVVLRDAHFLGAAFVDGGIGVVVEGIRIDGEGVAISLFCVFVFVIGEVGGAEIAVDGRRPGVIFQRLLVKLGGFLVVVLGVVDGAHVVERVGVVRIDAQGHLISLHGLIHGEEVVVSNADLCPSDGLL